MKLFAPKKIVLIGASTGGPKEIEKIISALPKLHNTCVVIGQHMAIGFIPSFIKRLQDHTPNHVLPAQDGEKMEVGNIYLCCGNTNLNQNSSEFVFSQKASPKHDFNPNINLLFNSFVPLTKECEALCCILTGIGNDGIEGAKALSNSGALCLTQTKECAIVDGMPGRARDEVPNIRVKNTNQIIQTIKEFCT